MELVGQDFNGVAEEMLLPVTGETQKRNPIHADEVNWDATGTASIEFLLSLSEAEKAAWSSEVRKLRAELVKLDESESSEEEEADADKTTDSTSASTKTSPATMASVTTADADDDTLAIEREEEVRRFIGLVPLDDPLNEVLLSRRGTDAPLSFRGIELTDLPSEIYAFLRAGIPRVEFFRLTGELYDSVAASELNTDAFEFVQGLFFYAGIDPADALPLFTQDDVTERQIEDASKVLDTNLRRLWGGQRDTVTLLACASKRKDRVLYRGSVHQEAQGSDVEA